MKLVDLTEADAHEIATWKYPEPYSFYDLESGAETMAELLDGTYFAVRDQAQQLIGFFCYGKNAQVLGGRTAGLYVGEKTWDIGLGMKPQLTGKGLGRAFLEAGMEFAVRHYAPSKLRLSVAAFNKRAIRLYGNMGFRESATFVNKDVLFLVMIKDL